MSFFLPRGERAPVFRLGRRVRPGQERRRQSGGRAARRRRRRGRAGIPAFAEVQGRLAEEPAGRGGPAGDGTHHRARRQGEDYPFASVRGKGHGPLPVEADGRRLSGHGDARQQRGAVARGAAGPGAVPVPGGHECAPGTAASGSIRAPRAPLATTRRKSSGCCIAGSASTRSVTGARPPGCGRAGITADAVSIDFLPAHDLPGIVQKTMEERRALDAALFRPRPPTGTRSTGACATWSAHTRRGSASSRKARGHPDRSRAGARPPARGDCDGLRTDAGRDRTAGRRRRRQAGLQVGEPRHAHAAESLCGRWRRAGSASPVRHGDTTARSAPDA